MIGASIGSAISNAANRSKSNDVTNTRINLEDLNEKLATRAPDPLIAFTINLKKSRQPTGIRCLFDLLLPWGTFEWYRKAKDSYACHLDFDSTNCADTQSAGIYGFSKFGG